MHRQTVLIALAALWLCSCGGSAPEEAAESASRLLAAASADDQAAFEAEIDRPALREDVRRQVTELAKVTSLDVEGGPSDFALDRMIGPGAVRLVRTGGGEALTAAPTAAQLAPLMRVVDPRHVCLSDAADPARCLLTFGRTSDGWRLVGMQATGLKITYAEAIP